MTTKKLKSGGFEAAMQELEVLVKKMEQGELSLEESIKNFERGVTLVKQCQDELKQAEQKVKILTSQGELVNYANIEAEDEV